MILADVMDQIGDRLDTITGLRVFRYPPDSVTPPAAIVSYPDEIVFDETYGRGMDRMTLPVVIVVGKVSDRTSKDRLTAYANGSGTSSVKGVIEGGTYTAFDTVRISRAEFDVVSINSTDYVAGLFDLDIAGQGA